MISSLPLTITLNACNYYPNLNFKVSLQRIEWPFHHQRKSKSNWAILELCFIVPFMQKNLKYSFYENMVSRRQLHNRIVNNPLGAVNPKPRFASWINLTPLCLTTSAGRLCKTGDKVCIRINTSYACLALSKLLAK